VIEFCIVSADFDQPVFDVVAKNGTKLLMDHQLVVCNVVVWRNRYKRGWPLWGAGI